MTLQDVANQQLAKRAVHVNRGTCVLSSRDRRPAVGHIARIRILEMIRQVDVRRHRQQRDGFAHVAKIIDQLAILNTRNRLAFQAPTTGSHHSGAPDGRPP